MDVLSVIKNLEEEGMPRSAFTREIELHLDEDEVLHADRTCSHARFSSQSPPGRLMQLGCVTHLNCARCMSVYLLPEVENARRTLAVLNEPKNYRAGDDVSAPARMVKQLSQTINELYPLFLKNQVGPHPLPAEWFESKIAELRSVMEENFSLLRSEEAQNRAEFAVLASDLRDVERFFSEYEYEQFGGPNYDALGDDETVSEMVEAWTQLFRDGFPTESERLEKLVEHYFGAYRSVSIEQLPWDSAVPRKSDESLTEWLKRVHRDHVTSVLANLDEALMHHVTTRQAEDREVYFTYVENPDALRFLPVAAYGFLARGCERKGWLIPVRGDASLVLHDSGMASAPAGEADLARTLETLEVLHKGRIDVPALTTALTLESS